MNQEPTPSPATARPAELGSTPPEQHPALPVDVRENWPDGSAAVEEQRGSPAPPASSSKAPELPTWRVRQEQGFDLLRVYLGIGLFVRGVLFAKDSTLIDQLLGNTQWFVPYLLSHGLMFAHVTGGVLLALGCYTRGAAAVQIPFVAGAVFLIHWHEGLLARSQSLEFAALVLFALILYALCGAGRLSIDHYFRRMRPEAAAQDVFVYRRPFTDQPLGTNGEGELALRRSARAELDEAELALPADTPQARADYRDVKRELSIVVVAIGVLFVLLAEGSYLAAPLWMIATMVLMVVWRVGKTNLPG